MLLALAIGQVIWKFQLLKVQVTLAVNAVPERSKAIAQLSWKLMHRWTCLGVCCGSCMDGAGDFRRYIRWNDQST
jgi:hypothetical protein